MNPELLAASQRVGIQWAITGSSFLIAAITSLKHGSIERTSFSLKSANTFIARADRRLHGIIT